MSKIHEFLLENIHLPVDAWTAGSLQQGHRKIVQPTSYQLEECHKIDFEGEQFRYASAAYAPVVLAALAVLVGCKDRPSYRPNATKVTADGIDLSVAATYSLNKEERRLILKELFPQANIKFETNERNTINQDIVSEEWKQVLAVVQQRLIPVGTIERSCGDAEVFVHLAFPLSDDSDDDDPALYSFLIFVSADCAMNSGYGAGAFIGTVPMVLAGKEWKIRGDADIKYHFEQGDDGKFIGSLKPFLLSGGGWGILGEWYRFDRYGINPPPNIHHSQFTSREDWQHTRFETVVSIKDSGEVSWATSKNGRYFQWSPIVTESDVDQGKSVIVGKPTSQMPATRIILSGADEGTSRESEPRPQSRADNVIDRGIDIVTPESTGTIREVQRDAVRFLLDPNSGRSERHLDNMINGIRKISEGEEDEE